MNEFGRVLTLISVVEAGSFSAAARKEKSSVTSVARQINSLEEELGVRLLNRSTRCLSLTEPGRLFYERACAISNDLRRATQEAKSFQESVKGVLRVSVRASAGTAILMPALPAFLAQFPELKLDLIVTDERQDLVTKNFDVAVWLGELQDSAFIARRLTPGHLIVCASPAYLQAHGAPRCPADLAQHNCMLFMATSYQNAWVFMRDGQREEIQISGNLRTDNGPVLLSAALAGLGLIVVHRWWVRGLLEEGRLVQVLEKFTVNPAPGNDDLYVVYPSNRGMSRKVRVFVDFLVSVFDSPDPTMQAAALLGSHSHRAGTTSLQ